VSPPGPGQPLRAVRVRAEGIGVAHRVDKRAEHVEGQRGGGQYLVSFHTAAGSIGRSMATTTTLGAPIAAWAGRLRVRRI
jgi:hypothetical protein